MDARRSCSLISHDIDGLVRFERAVFYAAMVRKSSRLGSQFLFVLILLRAWPSEIVKRWFSGSNPTWFRRPHSPARFGCVARYPELEVACDRSPYAHLCASQDAVVSKTRYVEYAGRGFWTYDVGLGVFLKHLIDAAEASDEAGTAWLSAAVSSWRAAAGIPDIGLTLDAGLSAEQRQTLVALAEYACARLARRVSMPAEEIVAWPILDDLRIFPRGALEVDTAPVVELGRAFIALVSGELPEAPTGKIWIYGTETGRESYPPDERFEDFPD